MAAIQRGLDAPARRAARVVLSPEGDVGRHLVTHPAVAAGPADRVDRDRRGCSPAGGPTSTSSPRPPARTRWSSRRRADVDLAVADLVRSAFGHAGPEVLGRVARDPRRHRRAAPTGCAASSPTPSRRCASARRPTSATPSGPLTEPAGGKLLRALTTLEPGESWLVAPRRLDDEGRLWSPGREARRRSRGSWFHTTECFGPVLGIMRVETLDEAIDAPERRRRSASPAACTRSTRPRSSTGWTASRSATPTSTGTSPARSCSASRSAAGRPRPSAPAPRPAARTTSRRSASWADSRRGPRRTTTAGSPGRRPTTTALWADEFARRARPVRPARRGERPALPPGPAADDPRRVRAPARSRSTASGTPPRPPASA